MWGGGGDITPIATLAGQSSMTARGANISTTVTFSSVGDYWILPLFCVTQETSVPQQVYIKDPTSCTFTNATVIERSNKAYHINATSTSVTVKMATGYGSQANCRMAGYVYLLQEG